MDVIVARDRADLAKAMDVLGEGRVALVPTMGALHEGHRSLIRLAHEHADHVVVSVFVNPLQFGPDEDFARYPRTLDADLAVCDEENVGVVFAPSADDLYLPDRQVGVSAGHMGTIVEGAFRPGHFDGVLTVVLKLLHLVRPDAAVFGAKDAQQLLAVRRMVADLDLDVEIVAVPTVREADGLARSSRNAYLSPAERDEALALSRALRAGVDAAASGADAPAVLAAVRGILDAADGVEVDYVALVDPATVEDLAPGAVGSGLLLVAARVGTTRLIDNATVEIAPATRADDPAGRAPAPGGTA